MKNGFWKTLVVSLALAIFLPLVCFAVESKDKGQKIFLAKCAQCHGPDAKGLPKMADVLMIEPSKIDLTRPDAAALSAAEMVKIVTEGKNKMLKFKKKLKDEEIVEVVKYVKSLQGSPAVDASPKKNK